jgi:hypothetical protein
MCVHREEKSATPVPSSDREEKVPTPTPPAGPVKSCTGGAKREVTIFEFVSKTDKALADMESGRERLQTKFQEVLRYFGEDPQMPPQQFFTTLESFVKVRWRIQRNRSREWEGRVLTVLARAVLARAGV